MQFLKFGSIMVEFSSKLFMNLHLWENCRFYNWLFMHIGKEGDKGLLKWVWNKIKFKLIWEEARSLTQGLGGQTRIFHQSKRWLVGWVGTVNTIFNCIFCIYVPGVVWNVYIYSFSNLYLWLQIPIQMEEKVLTILLKF